MRERVNPVKVLISADMEGITGVTHTVDVVEGKAGYERFRRLMTGDVNAAIAGAFAAGATEVLVNDSHWSMRNIILEELDPRAQLISGSLNKHLGMMQGIDASFAAVFFVGYHAMAGTAGGVINHTILGREIVQVRMNGKPVGETAINAAIAGYFGVPVVLVTGDDKVAAEARALLGKVETAVVKEGIERWTARCLPPQESTRRIKEAARRALVNLENYRPYRLEGPVEFEVDFMSTSAAELPTLFPCVVRKGPRTVSVTGKDIIEAYKVCRGVILLARMASDEVYG